MDGITAVAVGTNFYRQNYLFAFAPRPEVQRYIRTQGVRNGAALLPEIMDTWANAQPLVDEIRAKEAGIADSLPIENLPEGKVGEIKQLLDTDLVKKSYALPFSVAIVEIDKLVAPQRSVNLDYIDQLSTDFAAELSFDDLVKICLSPTRQMADIQHLEAQPNTHVFSSPSIDLRFLGAYLKELSPADLDYLQLGGVPAAAIISFIGYGASPISIFWSGKRAVLDNGFHRVYALRRHGVLKIPVLVQRAEDVQLAFPPAVHGLPREYLLGDPRPVLIKDFFEHKFNMALNVQKRTRTVTVQISDFQHNIPS